MRFVKYIGEFFLFRWLSGMFRRSDRGLDSNERVNRNPMGDHAENDEDLDDLDIFMRDDSGNRQWSRYSRDYDIDDWSDYDDSEGDYDSFDQSMEDFHEEHDHYDMLDDF